MDTKLPVTPYHWERSKAAQKSVDEMAKNPLTIEQVKEQAKRLNNGNQPLKDYHLAGNKSTIRAIAEMAKHPLTLELK